jgi:c(7)-type cytochrome triheme protein
MTAAVALCLVAAAYGIEGPVSDYGRVVLDGNTRKAGVAPAVFDHWRHRARFTCRLCHVDVGFAMSRGESNISASTNRRGFHCGACHDGSTRYEGKPIFASCSERKDAASNPTCVRCHSDGRAQSAAEYAALKLPRGPLFDVDWQKAEEEGKIHPLDALEGVSVARPPMAMDRDVQIRSQASWMTDVKFSHRKHAAWNGCEVCHPEIFPRTKAGATPFTMLDISGGQACGACHGKVAFPLAYCDRCHVKPVR